MSKGNWDISKEQALDTFEAGPRRRRKAIGEIELVEEHCKIWQRILAW